MGYREDIFIGVGGIAMGIVFFLLTRQPFNGPNDAVPTAKLKRPPVADQAPVAVRAAIQPRPSQPVRHAPAPKRPSERPRSRKGAVDHGLGRPDRSQPAATGSPAGPRNREELDRSMEAFIASRGVSAESFHGELAAAAQRNAERRETEAQEAETGLDEEALENFKTEYPVTDARRTPGGEIWLRVDGQEAGDASLDDMMAAAAELSGGTGRPVKVVVWQGNRVQAVRTFFGEPVF